MEVGCSQAFSSPPPAPTGSDMEEFLMRTLLATVALATLLSSSADAQYGARRGYRAYAQVPPYSAYYDAYAQAPYFRTPGFYDLYGRASPYPYSVYDTRGRYIGSDPDPRVRSQLSQDPTQGRD
jgi:hypothetical protein